MAHSEPGQCPLNHLGFHGFSWHEKNPAERGQPLLLFFYQDNRWPIDKIWVAKLAKSYLRKQFTAGNGRGSNKILFSKKQLAFLTYQKDMDFNAPVDHRPLYTNEAALWTAIHRAHTGLSVASSEWRQIHESCRSVGFEQIFMWKVSTPSRGSAQPSKDAACLPDSSSSSEESSDSDSESETEGEESESDLEDEGGEGNTSSNDARGEGGNVGGGRSRTEQQHERERILQDLDDEFDPDWEIDEEFQEVVDMLEKDQGETANQEEERLCAAYVKLEYLRGLRDARDGFTEQMDSLGAMISWMACQSLNKYNVLRYMIMYEARKPFCYVYPESGKETRVDPRHCLRILVDRYDPKDPEIPELFRWGQPFLKNRANRMAVEREIEGWKLWVQETCVENFAPAPEQVVFVADSKHFRGNSLLCVYGSSVETVAMKGKRVEMGGVLLRWTAVVNRRRKLKMGGGVSMPSLPTMEKASAGAKALADHTLGFRVHHMLPSYYGCGDDAGQRVLSECSIRVKDVPEDVSREEIQDWFEREAGVRPAAVHKDNAAKNRGKPDGIASMVADFHDAGRGCYEQEAVMEKAMLVSNSPAHMFRGQRVKLERIKKQTRGGSFSSPRAFSAQLLQNAAARDNLVPTPPAINSVPGKAVEFADGATVLGSSNIGCRVQIISEAFRSGASKWQRQWDVIGGESKAHSAVICLKPAEIDEVRALWPDFDSSHISVAQMRVLAQRFHNNTTIFHTCSDGTKTRIKASFEYVVGDVKSLCIHLGQDNKCPLCTAPYEWYHLELYAGEPRDAEFNRDCWLQSKYQIASLFAMALADGEFNTFLKSTTKCRTAEQLSVALIELKSTAALSRTLAELGVCAAELGQPGGEERVENFVRAYGEAGRGWGSETGGSQEETFKRLRESASALNASPDCVRQQLREIRGEWLLQFIASVVTPGVSPDLSDFVGVQAGDRLKALWGETVETAKIAQAFGAKLSSFHGALQDANDGPSLWAVLGNREIPELGFKAKGKKAEDVERYDLTPVSKSCAEMLVRLVKALNHHVTALPLDYRADRTGAGRPPKAVPAIMHTVSMVGRKILAMLPRYALTGPEGGDRPGARLGFAQRQQVIIKKEYLIADMEKLGDRISNSMNGEQTRVVLSNHEWMFGGLMALKYQQLAKILSLYFGLIYSGDRPSPQSRLACWLFGNLTFNLSNLIDRLATAKDKSTKKPVTQSNHFHIAAEEIPRFHEHCAIPLVRLLEEVGEAYQKVSKESGLKRSDRKTDQVETMYREEYMREEAILRYGLRGRDPEKGSKSSSLFAENIVPNLVIPSCIYNLDPVFHTTFSKLLLRMTQQAYAQPLLSVYLPPGYRGQRHPLPRLPARACQWRCYCKCPGCSKDCLCQCPAGCSHSTEQGDCRCRSQPMVIALTGQGPKGKGQFLVLEWCEGPHEDGQTTDEVRERIARLLGGLQTGVTPPDLGEAGQLISLQTFWQSASVLALQASYRRHLHKGLLKDASLERERLKRAVKFETSSPMVGAPGGGETLVIEGRGFRNLHQQPTVWVGPNKALAVQTVSNTRLSCTIPAGIGRNLQVWVTPCCTLYPKKPLSGQVEHLKIAGETATLRTGFSYDGPKVETVAPSTLPTEGGILELRGSNLARARVFNEVASSSDTGQAVVSIQVLDGSLEDRLLVKIGPGVGTRTTLMLENSYGTTCFGFAYEEPVIHSVAARNDQALGIAGGNQIIVTGTSFGAGRLDELVVKIGGRPAKWEMLEAHRRLEVVLPPSAGGRQPVQIWVGRQFQQRSSAVHDSSYVQFVAPSITSCTDYGSVGNVLSITGQNFGNGDDCAVKIGGFLCLRPSLRELHNRIVCQIPEGKGANLSIKVCVAGQWSSPETDRATATFSYKAAGAPKVNRRLPYVAPPTQDEANRIYSRYRLSLYHTLARDRNARTDISGDSPFTPSTVEEAKHDYKRLLEGLKNINKTKSKLMEEVSMAAWAQLKRDRGITAKLGGGSRKRLKVL